MDELLVAEDQCLRFRLVARIKEDMVANFLGEAFNFFQLVAKFDISLFYFLEGIDFEVVGLENSANSGDLLLHIVN